MLRDTVFPFIRVDRLFSLPFISLLLIPSMGSYATNINVIFFAMTWTTLVWSHGPLRVELVGTATVRLLCFIAPSVLFFLFDILIPSAAAVVKRNGEMGLPCGKKRGEIRKQDMKVAGWSLFNVALGFALQGLTELLLVSQLGWGSAVRVWASLPMPWETSRDLVFTLLLREAITYVVHRYILHNDTSRFTSWFTSLHREWFHELQYPYPLTANYDNPITWVLHRFIPTYLPAIIVRPHMLTWMLILTIISIEETFVFSGYQGWDWVPFTLYIGGVSRHVEEHVHSRGAGNFGPWGVFDWIFNTAIVKEFEVKPNPDKPEFRDAVMQVFEDSQSKKANREGTVQKQPRRRKQREPRQTQA